MQFAQNECSARLLRNILHRYGKPLQVKVNFVIQMTQGPDPPRETKNDVDENFQNPAEDFAYIETNGAEIETLPSHSTNGLKSFATSDPRNSS